MSDDELLFRARIVELILMKDTEEALRILSQRYGVDIPFLKVGMPKQCHGKVGCYVSKTKTIHVTNSEKLNEPFVILHEFYHHLRAHSRKRGGTEKHADRFAREFIEALKSRSSHSFRLSYKWSELRL